MEELEEEVKEKPRTLEEIVGDHFSYVIEDGNYVIGIDRTGVYVFADNKSDSEVSIYADDLCDDLDIDLATDVETITIKRSVEDPLRINEEEIATEILSRSSKRSFVFSEADIIELLDCFGYEPKAMAVEPEEEVADADLDSNAITVTRGYLANSQFTIMLFPFFGFLLMYLNIAWWLPFIPHILGFFMADRLGKATKSYMCTIIQALCVLGMIAAFAVFLIGDYDQLLGYFAKFQYFITHLDKVVTRW